MSFIEWTTDPWTGDLELARDEMHRHSDDYRNYLTDHADENDPDEEERCWRAT